mmetsp:Transcript_11122/g.21343  ORF Transcript_11122/g.21343 Transcript_11122/m.21343 type:complete len:416 (+) Transcript_11122:121-1368(+)
MTQISWRRLKQSWMRRLIIQQHTATHHDALATIQAAAHAHLVAILAAQQHDAGLEGPGRGLDVHQHLIVVHDQGRLRHHGLHRLRHSELHGREHIRAQTTVGVRDPRAHAGAPRVGLDHAGDGLHGRLDGLVGIGIDRGQQRCAHLDLRQPGFRHQRGQVDRIEVHQRHQRRRQVVHDAADTHRQAVHRAGSRRPHRQARLAGFGVGREAQCLEPALGAVLFRLGLGQLALRGLQILLGATAREQHLAGALQRLLSQAALIASLGGVAGGQQQVRRVQQRQHLALAHRVADLDLELDHGAAQRRQHLQGAGRVGLHNGGHAQLMRQAGGLHRVHRDARAQRRRLGHEERVALAHQQVLRGLGRHGQYQHCGGGKHHSASAPSLRCRPLGQSLHCGNSQTVEDAGNEHIARPALAL